MSTDSKYEKALLENASNLDAITRSNGEIYHCAERVISQSDTKDLLNIINFITKINIFIFKIIYLFIN